MTVRTMEFVWVKTLARVTKDDTATIAIPVSLQ